jgi:hypothetical protein
MATVQALGVRRWLGSLVRSALRAILVFLAAFFAAAIPLAIWYFTRPHPPFEQRVLFPGVLYTRESFTVPRPMVVHVVEIDLKTPGLSFLVTPGDGTKELPLRARTTSDFLKEFELQLAINGDFFEPWHSTHPLDFYPNHGEPCTVAGVSASEGNVYCPEPKRGKTPTLYISRDNVPSLLEPEGEVYNAISGESIFLWRGAVPTRNERVWWEELPPHGGGFQRGAHEDALHPGGRPATQIQHGRNNVRPGSDRASPWRSLRDQPRWGWVVCACHRGQE